MTTVPLWISKNEYIGVPQGTRATFPSRENFVVVQTPDRAVWLVWSGTDTAMRFPDDAAETVAEMYFENGTVHQT